MINLDSIEVRFHRGEFEARDVADLMAEGRQFLSNDTRDQFDRGIWSSKNMAELYSVVEQSYSKQYKRPTAAERVTAQKKADVEASVKIEALRAQVAARKAQLEQEMADKRSVLTKQVADAEIEAVTNKKGKEKAEYEEKAARLAIEFKKKLAADMRNVLEGR